MQKHADFTNRLQTSGEAGTVTYIQDTSAKLDDRGRHCMFVGYQENHSGDCYRMWYPTTNKILITREVIWSHRVYFKKRTPKNKMIKKRTKSKVGEGQ